MIKSANTLFHFTKTADNLIGILESGFYPRFCLEEQTTKNDIEMAIPMVCFCDIPLSSVSNHISFYGNYGIGMTKEWAIKKGINPVMYMSIESSLSNHFEKIIETYLMFLGSLQKSGLSDAKSIELIKFQDIIEVKGYAKPIFGKMYKDGAFIEKDFYNEREWRYVSIIKEGNKFDVRLSKSEFLDPIKLAQVNSDLSKKDKLKFDIDDIKYLIIDKESEITSMINCINKIFKDSGKNKVDILCSKIITTKQIEDDF